MKQRIRLIGAMIGVVVLSVVLGVVLMTGVYAIPKTMLVRNAEKISLQEEAREANYSMDAAVILTVTSLTGINR